MRFYMPVKVFDGPECVKEHARDICALGKKALIVTGKHSAFSNGSFDDVIYALEAGGTDYEVFSDVEENPSTDTVFAAKERFSDSGTDLVIGIGGGSPMDAAKAIALALKHPESDLDYLYDSSKDPSALPVVCVPTTCGTGSEVTGVSVLTRHDKQTKISMVHKVFPRLALIDGKYLSKASPALIASTAVDALSHLYESVLNKSSDDYVKMTAYAGLKMWSGIRDCLTGDKTAGEEDYAKMMRASAIAGMSIAQCGTSLPHALSYLVTYDLSLAHGRAVGYFIPGFLAAAPEKERDEVLKLSGFSDAAELSSFLDLLFKKQDIPEDILKKTYEAVKNNPAKMESASFAVDEAVLEKIVFDRLT